VIDHVFHRHWQGGGLALYGIAQGIAHEDRIYAIAVGNCGEARVVGGEHGDLFAFGAQSGERG